MKELFFITKILFKEKKDILLSIICGFIGGITAVGLFSASGYLISKAALAPPIYTLMLVVASVKLLGILSAISHYGERYYSHRGTFTMLSHLRVSFYEKIEPLAAKIFGQFQSGDLLSRIVGDVEILQNFFLRVVYPPIVLLLVFLSTIFFTMFFSVETALILLAGFMLTTILVPAYFAIKQRHVNHNVQEDRGNFSTEVTEVLLGYRDLKIYQKLAERESSLESLARKYAKQQEKVSLHHLYSENLNTFVSLIISVVVLAVGAYRVAQGTLDGVFLAMLLMISLTVFENTTSMAAFPSHLEDSRQAANRLTAVIKNQPQAMAKEELQILEAAPFIHLKDICFTYPGDQKSTLEGINLHFPSGSKTAIVGPSGSGKSTIFNLLLKINDADTGHMQINQQSVSGLSDESIWKHSKVILQENHFFYGNIRENLLIAKDGTDMEMRQALKKVALDHFQLDDKVLETGANLSGGEKQRLAMARAMLKDGSLWLLDEPTSSLDAITEANIYDELFQLAKADTLILISHRLNGLEKMDQIIVMEGGTVVESGSYKALMNKQGYFYELKQIEQTIFKG